MYSCCSLMCSDNEFTLWPCSLPFVPSDLPSDGPYAGDSDPSVHGTRQVPNEQSCGAGGLGGGRGARPVRLLQKGPYCCLCQRTERWHFCPRTPGRSDVTVPGFLCRSWRRRRNARDKRGSLVQRRKRKRSRPLRAHRELQGRGSHFYLNTPSPSIQSNKQLLFKVIKQNFMNAPTAVISHE